jgi:hypothetical protein
MDSSMLHIPVGLDAEKYILNRVKKKRFADVLSYYSENRYGIHSVREPLQIFKFSHYIFLVFQEFSSMLIKTVHIHMSVTPL